MVANGEHLVTEQVRRRGWHTATALLLLDIAGGQRDAHWRRCRIFATGSGFKVIGGGEYVGTSSPRTTHDRRLWTRGERWAPERPWLQEGRISEARREVRRVGDGTSEGGIHIPYPRMGKRVSLNNTSECLDHGSVLPSPILLRTWSGRGCVRPTLSHGGKAHRRIAAIFGL